jgi:hypothetical protein
MRVTQRQIDEIILMGDEMQYALEGADYERVKLAHRILCGTMYPYKYAPQLLELVKELKEQHKPCPDTIERANTLINQIERA